MTCKVQIGSFLSSSSSFIAVAFKNDLHDVLSLKTV